MKEVVRKRKEGIVVGGSNRSMQRNVLPSCHVLLGEEDSHNKNAFDWAFQKEGRVSIDNEKRVIKHDIRDNNGHVCNQSVRRNCNKKIWDLLLDNQSTCDVIINSKLLKNIRKCR